MSDTLKPEIFEIATDKGPEFVAAYPVGELRVHLRVGSSGYTITHAGTGMCAIPYGLNDKDAALQVAKVVDEAADWSSLKLASYGEPDWGDRKEEYINAAKVGISLAEKLDAISVAL